MDIIAKIQFELRLLSYVNNKLYMIIHNERLQEYDFRTKTWTQAIINNKPL
jgi:hypothetical protein